MVFVVTMIAYNVFGFLAQYPLAVSARDHEAPQRPSLNLYVSCLRDDTDMTLARMKPGQKDEATQCELVGAPALRRGESVATGGCRCDGTGSKIVATLPSSGGGSDATDRKENTDVQQLVVDCSDQRLMTAFCFMTRSVHQVIENAGMDASVAALIHEPWQVQSLAQAYDSAANEDDNDTNDTREQRRRVQREVRDMIVIVAFLGFSSWTYLDLRNTMDDAFVRRMEHTLESQIMQAATVIRRLGANRDECDRWLQRQYGTALQQQDADALFAVYKRCADTSPDFQSQTAKKVNAKGKARSAKRGKDQRDALSSEKTAATSASRERCESLAWLGGVPDTEVT